MDKNFSQFVTDLVDPANFNVWGPALALLAPGNFDGLIQFAGKLGYVFTAADVKAFVTAHRASQGRMRAQVAPMAGRSAITEQDRYLDAWAGN